MKRKNKVCICGCFSATFLIFNATANYADETDYKQTTGSVQVKAPNSPDELPKPDQPVYPLEPEQSIVSDQLTPSLEQPTTTEPFTTITDSDPATEISGESTNVGAAGVNDPTTIESIKESVANGTKNWLGFNYVTKTITFKVRQSNSKRMTIYADPIRVMTFNQHKQEEWPHYLQLSDERGRYSGWTLSVKQEMQFISTNQKTKQRTLNGAQLTLGTKNAPAQLLGTGTNTQYKPGKISQSTTLIPEVAADLVVAQQDQGLGTWIYRFGDEKTLRQGISLTVPTKQYTTGSYKTALTWSILDAPVA
ncbi:WxL domain-containing protein [Enterococcus faecalis]